MKIKKSHAWISATVLTLGSFALSVSFAGAGVFPQTLLTKVRRSLRPVLQLRSEKSAYDLNGLTVISLKSRDVDITIERAHSSDEKRLLVTLEGRFANENRRPLRVEADESRLQIQVDEDLRRKMWISDLTGEVRGNRLKLTLPRDFTGEISVENDAGLVEINALSLGNLSWTSVTGSLTVTDSEIHVAKLESISGDVTYSGSTPELALSLTSGSAKIQLRAIEQSQAARVDVISTSGEVEVALPKNASLRVSLSSMTGQVKSDFSLEKPRSENTNHSLEGRIGSGSGELRLRSVSGSVSLIRSPGP